MDNSYNKSNNRSIHKTNMPIRFTGLLELSEYHCISKMNSTASKRQFDFPLLPHQITRFSLYTFGFRCFHSFLVGICNIKFLLCIISVVHSHFTIKWTPLKVHWIIIRRIEWNKTTETYGTCVNSFVSILMLRQHDIFHFYFFAYMNENS